MFRNYPVAQAKIERPGTDVTIVAFSKMVMHSLEAAEELAKEGINAEVGASCAACVRFVACIGS